MMFSIVCGRAVIFDRRDRVTRYNPAPKTRVGLSQISIFILLNFSYFIITKIYMMSIFFNGFIFYKNIILFYLKIKLLI